MSSKLTIPSTILPCSTVPSRAAGRCKREWCGPAGEGDVEAEGAVELIGACSADVVMSA
jgi:hypothetical protein